MVREQMCHLVDDVEISQEQVSDGEFCLTYSIFLA